MLPSSDRPLLIYDGECRFCCLWIEHWKGMTGEEVRYERSQNVGKDFPKIPPEIFDGAVVWVWPDGKWCTGAEAVFRALATTRWHGQILLALYEKLSLFAMVADFCYRLVATNRSFFSMLTRFLWGQDIRPPQYAISTWIFLRAIGVVYLIAFLSFGIQMKGLIGENGILPAKVFFEQAGGIMGAEAYWMFPSLCWFGASDLILQAWCVAGIVFSLLLIAGVAPFAGLIFSWVIYLSLCVAGQIFYQYQWDALLLEAGFLAIFLAPLQLNPLPPSSPPRTTRFLMLWLLFRLIFASGVVKILSSNASWVNLEALDFHYFTQPLPSFLAWYADKIPVIGQKICVLMVLASELIVPFFLFAPRHFRMVAAGILISFQVLIVLSGNFGFFNLLVIALCLMALDDTIWRSLRLRMPEIRAARYLPRFIIWPVMGTIFLLSLIPLSIGFHRYFPILDPGLNAYESLSPFRSINSYGLFGDMTKSRRVIVIQGSEDGVIWKTYLFRYAPEVLSQAPTWSFPYMPRFDWQIWFASLSDMNDNPWFSQLLLHLLRGTPDVLSRFESNPFPDKPPRYVRATIHLYTFTTWQERHYTGNWWKEESAEYYCPEVSLAESAD